MSTHAGSLTAALASSGVDCSSDPDDLEFHTHDIVHRGAGIAAIVRPRDKHELATAVGLATAAGLAVVPRGGGMSYTGGYTPDQPGAVLFDLSRMNQVIAIDKDSMNVTVEAGCTWAMLHQQLEKHGLRTPMWGTLSGLKATIGGTMSQNGIFWGSARHGTAAQSCTALEVVLADGTLLALGKKHLRPYGPDLLGLFLADCGAMGIKATVTLRLMRELKGHAGASFSFDDRKAWLLAAAEIERQGLASECFGFDPFLNAIRMQRESLASDVRQLFGMMKQQASLGRALKEGAKVVMSGRDFLKDARYSLHVLAEERTEEAAEANIALARAICTGIGGKEIENTIPKMVRSNPFGPLNAIIGPEGERWVPIHGHVPHERANECFTAIEDLFARNKAEMDALGAHYGTLITVIAGGNTVLEPCLYWPDERNALIEGTVEIDHLSRLPRLVANPAARGLADRLRQDLVDLFFAFEAAHFQIGRTYRYRDSLPHPALDLLSAIKQQVDPKGLMNPGVLGIEPQRKTKGTVT